MSDRDPVILDGRTRVLGIVPGKPAAGDRKQLGDDDPVMVWPHLLVRHAVAALAVLLIVGHSTEGTNNKLPGTSPPPR